MYQSGDCEIKIARDQSGVAKPSYLDISTLMMRVMRVQYRHLPTIPLGIAYNSGNIGGSLKRDTGTRMQAMGGNCGGPRLHGEGYMAGHGSPWDFCG